MTETVQCQHCSASATSSRTFCPQCRRRLRPPDEAAGRVAGEPAVTPPTPAPLPTPSSAPSLPTNAAPAAASTPSTLDVGRSGPRGGLEWGLLAALAVAAVVEVFAVTAELHRATLLSRVARDSAFVSRDALSNADNRVHTAVALWALTVVVAGPLFITWLYRTVKLLDGIRGGVFRSRPGWAIGGWFVPILNLVRPKQMVDDAWRATDEGQRQQRVPLVFHLWWAAWLIAGLAAGFGGRGFDEDTASGLASADRVAAGSDAVMVVAGVLAAVVVWRLSAAVATTTHSPVPANSTGTAPAGWRFNPPPGWPEPPAGWAPVPGWQPDPAWPPPPVNWPFWVRDRPTRGMDTT